MTVYKHRTHSDTHCDTANTGHTHYDTANKHRIRTL